MGHVGVVNDGSILLSLFVLLLATMAVWLAIGHWQRQVVGTPKNLGSKARGSQSSQVAPVEVPHSTTAQAAPPQHPDASPLDIPCGCSPSCTLCVTVARELQDLVMSVWARNRMSFPLDSGMWQVLWENLKELVEQGHLPCCSSSSSSKSPHSSRSKLPLRTSNLPRAFIRRQASVFSISSFLPRTRFCKRYSILTKRPHQKRAFIPLKASMPSKSLHSSESLMSSQSLQPSESLSQTCQTPDGGVSIERSSCSLEAAGISRTHSSQKMHMAKKSLEVKTGAQPIPMKCSHVQVAQQEESCSYQCPSLDSWDAAAVPTGNTPCVGEAQRSTFDAKEVGDPPSPVSST